MLARKIGAIGLTTLMMVGLFGMVSQLTAQEMPVGNMEAFENMKLYEKAMKAAHEKLDLDEEELMEELKELEPEERVQRTQEIREEVERVQKQKYKKLKAERQEGFFDDIDGQVAVYSVPQNTSQGVAAIQEEGYLVEFCYAETGCEDRSDDAEDQILASTEAGLLHASDPDKEVVGLKLRYKILPESNGGGSAIVAEGVHNPDGRTSDARFEKENRLKETDTYRPGQSLTYELGRTDGEITASNDDDDDSDNDDSDE